jgi:hypothetical protein
MDNLSRECKCDESNGIVSGKTANLTSETQETMQTFSKELVPNT